MKHITRNHINLGFTFVVLGGISFVIGIYYRFFLIFAGIFLISYIILDRKKLRCPNCEAFESLGWLMHAKNNIHYCRSCGERIVVLYND